MESSTVSPVSFLGSGTPAISQRYLYGPVVDQILLP